LAEATPIATYQGLARVAEKDLDALGLEKPQTQAAQKPASTANGEVSEEDVWNQLRQCYDPEIPVNIVDLGLVYDCRLLKKPEGGTKVEVKMTLTAPAAAWDRLSRTMRRARYCPSTASMKPMSNSFGTRPWNQNMISEAGRMKLGMI
jgi:metal-sulfur cluster biosynthetic enzyme